MQCQDLLFDLKGFLLPCTFYSIVLEPGGGDRVEPVTQLLQSTCNQFAKNNSHILSIIVLCSYSSHDRKLYQCL